MTTGLVKFASSGNKARNRNSLRARAFFITRCGELSEPLAEVAAPHGREEAPGIPTCRARTKERGRVADARVGAAHENKKGIDNAGVVALVYLVWRFFFVCVCPFACALSRPPRSPAQAPPRIPAAPDCFFARRGVYHDRSTPLRVWMHDEEAGITNVNSADRAQRQQAPAAASRMAATTVHGQTPAAKAAVRMAVAATAAAHATRAAATAGASAAAAIAVAASTSLPADSLPAAADSLSAAAGIETELPRPPAAPREPSTAPHFASPPQRHPAAPSAPAPPAPGEF